jgi:exoribonuclease R
MEDKIGESYDGIISGITDRGIYVEINDNKCEGMVSIKSIEDDQYFYDQSKHQLEGYVSGKIYKLGDPIKVVVKKADLINRHLDFILKT